MVCRSGILGQLERRTIEEWFMKVEVQTKDDRKLITTYGCAERDGIHVQYDPILLANRHYIEKCLL